VIYDFRPEAWPVHRANAHRAQRGLCYWNGAEMKDVCYADTDGGVLALVARGRNGQAYDDGNKQPVLHWMQGGVVVVIEQPSELLETVRKPRAYDLDAEHAVMG